MLNQTAIGKVHAVVIDVSDLRRAAAFWSAVLGMDIGSGASQYLKLSGREGGPAILLQRVSETKVSKNRVHLDIEVADPDTAIERVEALGGSKLRLVEEPGIRFIVAADPDGNEFCLVPE